MSCCCCCCSRRLCVQTLIITIAGLRLTVADTAAAGRHFICLSGCCCSATTHAAAAAESSLFGYFKYLAYILKFGSPCTGQRILIQTAVTAEFLSAHAFLLIARLQRAGVTHYCWLLLWLLLLLFTCCCHRQTECVLGCEGVTVLQRCGPDVSTFRHCGRCLCDVCGACGK